MKGVIYEEIFKFIVKYWIDYRNGSYECNGTKPVSYTHLDVYKRQPIFLANSGRVQPMIFERVTVTINDRAITIASPEL